MLHVLLGCSLGSRDPPLPRTCLPKLACRLQSHAGPAAGSRSPAAPAAEIGRWRSACAPSRISSSDKCCASAPAAPAASTWCYTSRLTSSSSYTTSCSYTCSTGSSWSYSQPAAAAAVAAAAAAATAAASTGASAIPTGGAAGLG